MCFRCTFWSTSLPKKLRHPQKKTITQQITIQKKTKSNHPIPFPLKSPAFRKTTPTNPTKKVAPPTWFTAFYPLSWRSLYSPKWSFGHLFQPSSKKRVTFSAEIAAEHRNSSKSAGPNSSALAMVILLRGTSALAFGGTFAMPPLLAVVASLG